MTKTWESGDTPAGRFAARLRAVAKKKGLDLDGIVRLSPRFKYSTVTRWYFGTRVPRAASIVDLARALEIDPRTLLRGVDLDERIMADVVAIVASEKSEPRA